MWDGSHSRFCNFTANTDRYLAPELVLINHFLCELTAPTLGILATFVFPSFVNCFCCSPTHGVVHDSFTVNFLPLTPALVSLRQIGKVVCHRLPYTYVFKPIQKSGSKQFSVCISQVLRLSKLLELVNWQMGDLIWIDDWTVWPSPTGTCTGTRKQIVTPLVF